MDNAAFDKLYGELKTNIDKSFDSKFKLIDCTLQQRNPGIVCEFGVYKGETVNYIASKIGTVYGFDCFTGLPEAWHTRFVAGKYAVDKEELVFHPDVKIYDGLFSDTIPVFNKEVPGHISFIHVDCDLYSSTRDVLYGLVDRIGDGTILHFDELWQYDAWKEHEAKAFLEFITDHGYQYDLLGTTKDQKKPFKDGQQAAVKLKKG